MAIFKNWHLFFQFEPFYIKQSGPKNSNLSKCAKWAFLNLHMDFGLEPSWVQQSSRERERERERERTFSSNSTHYSSKPKAITFRSFKRILLKSLPHKSWCNPNVTHLSTIVKFTMEFSVYQMEQNYSILLRYIHRINDTEEGGRILPQIPTANIPTQLIK